MERLLEEGGGEALAVGASAAAGEHVGGEVDAVDIDAVAEEGKQQPAGAAPGVERGLAMRGDEPSEVADLGAGGVELIPPASDEAVVPGIGGHARLLRRSGCRYSS